MDAYSKRFASSLSDLLTAKKRELTDLLVSTPAPDHAAYMERVGRIKGVEFAIETASDLETKMSAPDKVEKPKERHASYED